MSQGAAATVVKTVVRPVTVEAVVDSVATAARAAPVVQTAADSVETAADSAEPAEAVASAPPVGKCSMQFARNVVRKRKFPSSPAVLAQFIAGIASRLTVRHVVAAVVAWVAIRDRLAAELM